MGPIGIPELIFIFILALLIFGPRKLPELGRTFGKALSEFRRASGELRSAVEDEMRNLERETEKADNQIKGSVKRALDSGEGSATPEGEGAPDGSAPASRTPPGQEVYDPEYHSQAAKEKEVASDK